MLEQETEVKNKASGFMRMGAEGQKVLNSGEYFGEHNAKNKRDGRCIQIKSNGEIYIAYY